MTEQDKKEAEAIADARIARALRMLDEEMLPTRSEVQRIDILATIAALESPPTPDPLSLEAFRGRTTPNGLPVRWVAWDQEGVPFEYSTAAEPHRNARGALHNPSNSLNSRFDLLDPARAGQTLWVGEGPDPRTVQAPGAIAVPCAAPSTLPPLVGPDRPCLTWQDSAEHGSEWERIARAERAAREADIARLEREVSIRRGEVNDCLAQLRETHALRMQAEREREEARATAAQLAVERDALAEKWEAVVRIRRIFGGAS